MSEKKPIGDSSIARIAGNIAGPLAAEAYTHNGIYNAPLIASESVRLARLIIAELESDVSDTSPRPEGRPT